MTNPNPPFRMERFSYHCVISVDSRLDQSRWNDLNKFSEELLEEIEKETSNAYLVDLSGLDYISSATLALIVRVWKTIDRRNDRMVIVTSHVMVREVLRLSGLLKLWTIVPDLDDGLARLGVGGKRRPGKVDKKQAKPLVFGISFLLLIVSAAGLYVRVFDRELVADSTMMEGFALGSAILGFLFSTYLVFVVRGWKRMLAVFLGVCFLSALVLAFLIPNVFEIGKESKNSNALSKVSKSSNESSTREIESSSEISTNASHYLGSTGKCIIGTG